MSYHNPQREIAVPLTADQMNRITVDYLTGRPLRDKGPEVDAFLADLKNDVERIRAQGGEVQVPSDQPDPD